MKNNEMRKYIMKIMKMRKTIGNYFSPNPSGFSSSEVVLYFVL